MPPKVCETFGGKHKRMEGVLFAFYCLGAVAGAAGAACTAASSAGAAALALPFVADHLADDKDDDGEEHKRHYYCRQVGCQPLKH